MKKTAFVVIAIFLASTVLWGQEKWCWIYSWENRHTFTAVDFSKNGDTLFVGTTDVGIGVFPMNKVEKGYAGVFYSNFPREYWKYYSDTSTSSVIDLIQSKAGFFYVATYNGLYIFSSGNHWSPTSYSGTVYEMHYEVRADGSQDSTSIWCAAWRKLLHIKDDTIHIIELPGYGTIKSVAPLPNGVIGIADQNNGLAFYNPKTDSIFHSFYVLNWNAIYEFWGCEGIKIFYDPSRKKTWGLYCAKEDGWKQTVIFHDDESSMEMVGQGGYPLPQDYKCSFGGVDQFGWIWLENQYRDLFKWDGKQGYVSEIDGLDGLGRINKIVLRPNYGNEVWFSDGTIYLIAHTPSQPTITPTYIGPTCVEFQVEADDTSHFGWYKLVAERDSAGVAIIDTSNFYDPTIKKVSANNLKPNTTYVFKFYVVNTWRVPSQPAEVELSTSNEVPYMPNKNLAPYTSEGPDHLYYYTVSPDSIGDGIGVIMKNITGEITALVFTVAYIEKIWPQSWDFEARLYTIEQGEKKLLVSKEVKANWLLGMEPKPYLLEVPLDSAIILNNDTVMVTAVADDGYPDRTPYFPLFFPDSTRRNNTEYYNSKGWVEFPFAVNFGLIFEPGTGVEKNPLGEILPKEFSLAQNYPNPFNSETVIEFSLPKPGNVLLKVYNALGQEVAVLVDERRQIGHYQSVWNAGNLPSGVYFYRLIVEGDESRLTKKMLLVR